MLNPGMFTSSTDLWETPQEFFDHLNEEFHFDLDVCALPENAKCKNYYTPEQDGLSKPWYGTCWCNPPYEKEIRKWIHRASIYAAAGNTVVMLLPARTDTKWFHEYIYKRTNVEIRFIPGRLKFGGGSKQCTISVYDRGVQAGAMIRKFLEAVDTEAA